MTQQDDDRKAFEACGSETVDEGSFNYTSAAEHTNAENVLVLHDPAVAATYGMEWERLWSESRRSRPNNNG